MSQNTYGTYLMKGKGSTAEKLVDIKDYPDLQGEPNLLDDTDLSSPAVTQIFGIKQAAAKSFTANYDLEVYESLLALEGTEMEIGVWFGHDAQLEPDGHDGKFEGKGRLSVVLSGAGSNAVREMVLTFAMSEEFTLVS